MLKDVLSNGVLTSFATVGLVIFVIVFLLTGLWILTRTRREVDDWASLPLSSDDAPPLDDRQSRGDHAPTNGTA